MHSGNKNKNERGDAFAKLEEDFIATLPPEEVVEKAAMMKRYFQEDLLDY